jgi:acetolactate synthase-1/2/3 large subunit
MKAAEALAACMERAGVKRVYGVVGTSVVSFINVPLSISRKDRYISCRHEQVCASMADSEGRLTGRPGIAVSHSGPGTLNTAISLAIAWKDSSPMVAVSGAVSRKLRGLGGFLEVEHGDVFRPICKATYRVEEAGAIAEVFLDLLQSIRSI